ncbi:Family of serine hydrolases 3 [Gnomoniopsis sp. IMI 355080]|nr:Family of serine hydrolases 3 [Gnomoniopsis sp. IMI 355080]
MAGDKAGGASEESSGGGTREIRILMLHGYTQSGPLFRSKTRALEKLLAKALTPFHLTPTLIYPTAPNRLSAADIPGYPSASSPSGAADEETPETTDAWAWFRKDEASGSYRLLDEGMARLAQCIRDDAGGRVDGVLGFSQGGFVASLLAAVLDSGRTVPEESRWATALREANGGRALKFAVVYSGFFAPQADLAWLYEPKISTPTLHFIGSLDTVVEEGRSRGLVARCEEPVVAVHPGGHYVPVSRDWVNPLVGFVRKYGGDDGDADEA